jgi:hypothetical protein
MMGKWQLIIPLKVVKFKHLQMTLTNQNCMAPEIHEEQIHLRESLPPLISKSLVFPFCN